MTHSPSLRFFNNFKSGKDDKKLRDETVSSHTLVSKATSQKSSVQGWLKSVRPSVVKSPVGRQSERTLIDDGHTSTAKNRPASIASEDSVNLDALINANYTSDVDKETDLPNLGELDIDDSQDDFWRLDKNRPSTDIISTFDLYQPDKSVINDYDLDWNPDNDNSTNFTAPVPEVPLSDYSNRDKRSSSMSSDNSLNSQVTVTQYAKYGLTPMTYASESSSTSSRSLSRQSNYSSGSSNTASAISQARINASANTIPSPSRSYSLKENNTLSPKSTPYLTVAKSPLNKQGSASRRASHIPAPATRTITPPSPQQTIATINRSKTTANSKTSQVPTTNSTIAMPRRLPQRASHIPTIRETIHRPNSSLHYTTAASQTSRVGQRSPTPGSKDIRNSIFSSNNNAGRQSSSVSGSRIASGRRSMTPTSMRPSGPLPPETATSLANGRSLPSRIGSYRK